jgi:hypothetical protein
VIVRCRTTLEGWLTRYRTFTAHQLKCTTRHWRVAVTRSNVLTVEGRLTGLSKDPCAVEGPRASAKLICLLCQ